MTNKFSLIKRPSSRMIESDPNRVDDQEYIIRLVCRVVTVSVETVRLVRELAEAVTMEDWMDNA